MAGSRLFVSLRHRNVRRFFLGLLISSIGTWVQLTALALLVYDLTGNARDVGLTLLCLYLPTLLLGAWAGVLADRHDKLLLTKITQSAQCAQAAVLGVLTILDLVSVPVVYGLTLALGVANAIDSPARRGFVTEMVSADEIGNAVSLNTAAITGSRIVGPALGALLAEPLGTGTLFLINAATFGALLVSLFTIDQTALRRVPPAPLGERPVREALSFIRSRPALLSSFTMIVVIGTFAFNHSVSLLKIADVRLGDRTVYGLMLAAMGVGSVIGSLVTASRQRVGMLWLYATCVLFAAAGAALAWAPATWMALVLAVPVGIGTTGFVTAHNAICQQETPDAMRGRILALGAVALLGSTPIGAPITGWIADSVGAEWSLAYGSVVTALVLPIGFHLADRRTALDSEAIAS